MLNPKDIVLKNEARDLFFSGADKLANAVKVTLGPKGRNVVIDQLAGIPLITKDGVSVARSIKLPNSFENMGAEILKQVSLRVNQEAGDGTTTSTVVAQSIISRCREYLNDGNNPVDLKRGIDIAAKMAVNVLKNMAVDCKDSASITNVATISANGDKHIGKLINKAIEQAGNDGIITVQESNKSECEIDKTEGLQFDGGQAYPVFSNTNTGFISDETLLLLVDGQVSSFEQVKEAMQWISEQRLPFVIMADDFSEKLVSMLIQFKMNNQLNEFTLIKSPYYGHNKTEFLNDIAVATGGKVVGGLSGVDMKTDYSDPSHYVGNIKHINVTSTDTTMLCHDKYHQSIDDRVSKIKESFESRGSLDLAVAKERVSKLTDGVVIIKVGGVSQVEMKELKDRVEDALYATQAAINEGIVAGGGVTLFAIAEKLAKDIKTDVHFQHKNGFRSFIDSLYEPRHIIFENAGTKLLDAAPYPYGTDINDSEQSEPVSMFDIGVIDPVRVTRNVIEQAASVAGMMITTDVLITDIKENGY